MAHDPSALRDSSSSCLRVVLVYFFNVANFYDYVPLRVFADGDIWHFDLGSGISPWVVYVIGGYLVLWAIVDLYRSRLPWILDVCEFEATGGRAVLLILVTGLLFAYYAVPALMYDNVATTLLSRTSLFLIPIVLLLTWNRIVLVDKSVLVDKADSSGQRG